MFHVNQKREGLLADAELGEDRAEHLLDIDPAHEPAEMVRGDPQLLGLELGRKSAIAVTLERGERGFKFHPVPRACQDRSPRPLPGPERGFLRERVNEQLDALACLCRNAQSVAVGTLARREIDLVQDRSDYGTALARLPRCDPSRRLPL